jgi:hypothetical protein
VGHTLIVYGARQHFCAFAAPELPVKTTIVPGKKNGREEERGQEQGTEGVGTFVQVSKEGECVSIELCVLEKEITYLSPQRPLNTYCCPSLRGAVNAA